MTGGVAAGRARSRWKAARVYWSGIGGVAEPRAAVADVVPVVDLVVVVERRALAARVASSDGIVDDGAPAGLAEGVAEGEPVAGHELVVALLVVDPQPGLQRRVGEPADAAERRRGRGSRCAPSSRPRASVRGAGAQDGVDAGREAACPGRRPGRSSRRRRRARPCRAGRRAGSAGGDSAYGSRASAAPRSGAGRGRPPRRSGPARRPARRRSPRRPARRARAAATARRTAPRPAPRTAMTPPGRAGAGRRRR